MEPHVGQTDALMDADGDCVNLPQSRTPQRALELYAVSAGTDLSAPKFDTSHKRSTIYYNIIVEQYAVTALVH